jgi:methionyl-tRNA synthetase
MSRFYVTTPIYYVNDVPHLGTSYTTIAADALRRYHVLRGDVTRMLTGTDEHGLKLEREARERGVQPEQFVREMSDRFAATWPKLQVQADDFVRTTEPRHERRAQELWVRIRERNPEDIYLGDYEGWYCVGCEELKTEKELEQPGNLCPLHKRPVERIKETSYFFRLSRYQDKLLDHYRRHPEFILPETRRNEVVSFVAAGLRDLSVSRTSFSWGVPVPGDAKHVMYVWFDALSNYWTVLQDSDALKPFWSPDAKIIHLIGKDILRFHAVYWPAFLMSAGLELPTTVFAHGFLTFGGQKMSKSLRNAVDPLAIAQTFGRAIGGGDGAGAEVLRYQLLRAISFGQDGDFDLGAMVERYNADLGKNVGNLLSRTLGLCAKMTGGKVPVAEQATALELDLKAAIEGELREVTQAWDSIEPHRALERTWAISSLANQYVDRAAPWSEDKKGSRGRVHTILGTLVSVLDVLSKLVWPVMPSKSDEMRAQLGRDPLRPRAGDRSLWPVELEAVAGGETLLPGGSLFPTLDPPATRALIDAMSPRTVAPPEPAPASGASNAAVREATLTATPALTPAIDYDAFAAVDLRVGIVRSCERVPKKDKLLLLTVDLGEPALRTIVAGLALSFQPSDLVGRRVVVVANLAPREFAKGLVSQGMLLATGPSDKLILATVDGDVPPGARLK